MGDSLRDQLLKSGIVKQVRDEPRPPQTHGKTASSGAGKPGGKGGKPGDRAGGRPDPRPSGRPHAPSNDRPRDQAEIDLARAYAMRAQVEAAERKRAEQEAAEQARIKRERKAQVQQLLEGRALNKVDADQARHFEYGGKIRRIYVDAAQLVALNAGELGVIQLAGHYVLVTRELAEQVRAIDAGVVALLVSPGEAGEADDGVPADLIW
ncbi:DUF2058 domain-containing protein [Dyella sp. KRB-257]|uniref:DUF2058 domain-containing protein n=1 Tax=Dyella sp. KRB-257 TaxID=3400915 RepID=UPI003C0BE011